VRIQHWIVVVVGALALATVPALAASPPSGSDPTVRRWPSWPYETTCGNLSFDPVAAFSGQTDAELAATPQGAALRQAIDEFQSLDVHKHYWRLLAEDGGVAEFAHGRLPDHVETLTIEKQGESWKGVGYSSRCEPTDIFSQGPVVAWSLDRSTGALRAGTREIKVNLGPGPCNSGMSQNKHAHAAFRVEGKKLLMTIWLDPLPRGGYTCQGLIEPPLAVKLPRHLGGQTLYDGSTYPPLTAGQTRHRQY
jgi:hypothetical protein